MKKTIILGIFVILFLPFISAYSGTSTSFNVTNLIIEPLGIYEENNSEYIVNLGIFNMPIGNESSTYYEVCFGYFCMWPFPSPPVSEPTPGAARGGGGGGFTEGAPNIRLLCLAQNGTWVGNETNGYCEYPKELGTIGEWLKYWLERLSNIRLKSFEDIKNIGAAISPTSPNVGWIVFGLGIYMIYIFLIIVPKVVKGQLLLTKKLSFFTRLGLFAIFTLTILIILLYILNIQAIMTPAEIGSRISPSNSLLGWILFVFSLYLILKVFPTLFKYFVHYKVKQNSLKKEAIQSIPQASFGGTPFLIGGRRKEKKKPKRRPIIAKPVPSNIFKELGIKIPKKGELK